MNSQTRLGIVVAQFNPEITDKMLKEAVKHASEANANITYVYKVPGSFDMPLAIQILLQKNDVDAVVTLGAIVRGETKHDEVIAHALAAKILDLSAQYNKAVSLGVAGPGMTWHQAKARTKEYADRSVDAAIAMFHRKKLAVNASAASYPVVIE